MVAKANTESQSRLAKLLAKENIQVHIGNYHTAFFDVKQRLLGLPSWNTDSKHVSDLLIGHEVGHALHTPSDAITRFKEMFPSMPFDIANVVEDIRIERLIRDNYPGLVFCFKEGYRHFIAKDFFKIENVDISQMGFVDRLNLRGKIGNLVDIPLSTKEEKIYKRCVAAETYDDVLEICRDVIKMVKSETKKQSRKKDEDQSDSEMPSNDDSDGDSDADIEMPSNEMFGKKQDEETQQSLKDLQSNANSDQANSDQHLNEKSQNQSTQNGNPNAANQKSIERELTSTTLNSLNDNLKNLQVDASKVAIGNSPTTNEMLSRIIPAEEIMAGRRSNVDRYNKAMNHPSVLADWTSFKNSTKKHIAVLVKEFERRKAAFQYSRATQSHTGTIDVNRLHCYKFEDQIFKSVTRLADAKDHGMVFFIDYSGSMSNTIGRVLTQTLQLVYFCKAVGIPFEVYGFTTPGYCYYESNDFTDTAMPGYNIDFSHTNIIELLNSRMSKTTFELACRELRSLSFVKNNASLTRDDVYDFNSKWESMNGTPLHETIIIAHAIVNRFRTRHRVQKMNTIFLTDGDGNAIRFNKNKTHEEFEKASPGMWSIPVSVDINGTKMTFAGNDRHVYANLIENLKKTCDTTVIGFFIANYKSEFKNNSISALRYSRASKYDSWDNAVSTFNNRYKAARKEKCLAIENGFKYDIYFTFDSIKNLDINDDGEEFECDVFDSKEFNASSNTSQNKIAREFTKFQSEKKTSRVFLNKFAEFIA
jgi:hypothetical protein